MRMDIFDKLGYEAKRTAFDQFIGVYGIDEFLGDCNESTPRKIMEEFECAIDSDGCISPPDNVTLIELVDIALRYGNQCDAEAVVCAIQEARDYVISIGENPKYKTLNYISAICEAHGVYFVEEEGRLVFVG